MNDELIALVERASAQTAPWLGQKRQLSLRMFDRLAAGDPALLADWQTDPDLGVEQVTSRGDGDLVEQPLLNAAPQFSELLQENLMEKALAWQGNQENAAHLALLNGGRFLYVPDGTERPAPVVLAGEHSHPNVHDLILVGAGATVTIIDDQPMATTKPSFHATELLLGERAHVNFYQLSDFGARVSRQVVACYQAQYSQLAVTTVLGSHPAQVTRLTNWLDGQGAQADYELLSLVDEDSFPQIEPHFKTAGPAAGVQFSQRAFADPTALVKALAATAPRIMVDRVSQRFH